MFYSHEILTSREGGIATVWLVATLGSKTSNKKVNRKSILEVDVPKTCEIIIQPEAPMALRLQGNLLYGVTRVFSRQYEYVLSDAQIIQSNIRSLLKAVRTSELDPNAGRANPELLVIHDDPAFLPDIAMPGLGLDMLDLDFSTDRSSRHSSILSRHSPRSSLSSTGGLDQSMVALEIPSSVTPGAGEGHGFQLPSSTHESRRASSAQNVFPDEDDGLNIDPGFSFDDEGNLVEDDVAAAQARDYPSVRIGSDSGASGQVRQQILDGIHAARPQPDNMNIGFDQALLNDDDDIILPDAEAFPPMATALGRHPQGDRSSSTHEDDSSTESAKAPMRPKKKAIRQLPVDLRQELRNTDLAGWKEDYVANMDAVRQNRAIHKANYIAKRNAFHWVVGAGIGGVGVGLGVTHHKSPLDVFSGDALMRAITGAPTEPERKRSHHSVDVEEDSDSEGRRTRPRDDDDQLGRGDDGVLFQDDEPSYDIANEETEVGRHALPPLEDPSFPWNVSASLRTASRAGSLVPSRESRGYPSLAGIPTSAGGAPSDSLPRPRLSSLDRRRSRLPTVSPLVGRGQQHRYSSLDLPNSYSDDGNLLEGDSLDPAALEGFELYGPGAAVDTQTAAQSQWVRSALTKEAENFLEFVQAALGDSAIDEDEDELSGDGIGQSTVLFETLLPPRMHSKLVGAQALHHVLTLATASKLNVRQVEGFGDIELAINKSGLGTFVAPERTP